MSKNEWSRLDIIQLLEDYGVQYWTEGNNVNEGWANIQCPLCGDNSNHGGFSIDRPHYNCWRCGHHSIQDVFSKLLGLGRKDAVKLLLRYNIGTARYHLINKEKDYQQQIELRYPPFTSSLQDQHRHYLEKRNFDPDLLIRKFSLLGTNHLSTDYTNMIIAPIITGGQAVSFQGRDITGRRSIKYKACAKQYEVQHHKHLLYNIDSISSDSIIITEGVTDVWRLGDNTVATFGINYSLEQVDVLRRMNLKNVFILYDADVPGQKMALKLSSALSAFLSSVEVVVLDDEISDPAEMGQDEANQMKKELLGYGR